MYHIITCFHSHFLTDFIIFFYTPENIRKPEIPDVFRGKERDMLHEIS